MASHSDQCHYPKHLALLAALILSIGPIELVFDTASAQQQHFQQQAQVRRAATRINPPKRTDTTPTNTTPATLPTPAIDKASELGQALAACNQDAAVQETFTLPGLKGEVTLDRCYKGRAHLICVFTALSTEAKSLTDSYRKIVDANYPELNSVDGVCQVNPETLASNIAGTEDFAKRFKDLKSQYDAATNCAGNVEQAFKNVTLTDMTQAPEILKSMVASIDGDVAKISKIQEQLSDFAEKIELSKKAMKVITKIHHALCMSEKAAQSGAERGLEHR